MKPLAAGRNTNLDALRAIAILMVLGRHFDYFAFWTRVGWAGVDLFFVLSGFLISGLLFAGFKQTDRIGLSRFYIRRGLKIWPAFYVMIGTGLLIDALLPGHTLSTQGLAPELLFVQNYFRGIWGITWSLAVEEHFYLSLPLLLILISRNHQDPFRSLPYAFGVVAAFALLCRFVVGWNENGTENYLTYLYPTHLRMDGLMFGVLLSYYKHFRPAVFDRIVAWRGGWIIIIGAVSLLALFPVENRQMHTWGLTVLYIGFGLVVAKAVSHRGTGVMRVLSVQAARIGFYSYSIYLWHAFFLSRIFPHFHVESRALGFWIYLIGSVLFGVATSKLIEIPILRFRDRVFSSESNVRLTPTVAYEVSSA